MQLAFVLLISAISAALGACPTGSTRWSSAYGSTAEGAAVTISGQVLLDVSTPILGALTIPSGSGLYFDPSTSETNLTLTAREIYVQSGGKLYVGCEETPFPKIANIVLWGTYAAGDGGAGFGRKVLGIAEGATVEIVGRSTGPTWTRLSESLEWSPATFSSTDKLTVLDSVNWRVGETILVASTDYAAEQSETRTITAINGKTITVDTPFLYPHFGTAWRASESDDEITMRAEVAMLDRNVRISGSNANAGWGGLIVVGGTAHVRLVGVEMSNMGQVQASNPAVYFRAGDHFNSRVSRCTIRDSFKGGVVLSDTNNLEVSDNVCYNVAGNTYSILNSAAVNNLFHHNLAVLILRDGTDQSYGFKSYHPANHWTDNAACGNGFWLKPDLTISSTRLDQWPRYDLLGSFRGNVFHSCESYCLFTESHDPRRWELNATFVEGLSFNALQTFVSSRPAEPAEYSGTIIYRSRVYGVLFNSRNSKFVNAKIADCRLGIGVIQDGSFLENVVINGETTNVGLPSRPAYEQGRSRPSQYTPQYPIYGVSVWDCCGPITFINVRFHNFNNYVFEFDPLVRYAGAITVNTGEGVNKPDNKFFNTRFYNTSNRFYLPAEGDNSLHNFVMYDTDGSLTRDLPNRAGGCGSMIVGTPFSSDCVNFSDWRAFVCPPSVPHRSITIEDTNDQQFMDTVPEVWSRTAGYLESLADGREFVLSGDYVSTSTVSGIIYQTYRLDYNINIKMNTQYLIRLGSDAPTPNQLRVSLYNAVAGDGTSTDHEFVTLAIPYPISSGVNFTRIGSGYSAVNSVAALTPRTYFIDAARDLLWVCVARSVDSWSWYSGLAFYNSREAVDIHVECAIGNCTVPSIDEIRTQLPLAEGSAPSGPVYSMCEANGGFTGGRVSYSLSGTPITIFDDAFAGGWRSYATNWNTTNYYPGPLPVSDITGRAVFISCNPYNGAYWLNPESGAPKIAGHTHLSFRVRSNPVGGRNSDGTIGLIVRASNPDNRQYGDALAASNPWYSPDGPVGEDKWYQVYIPVKDLGMKEGDTLYRFDIYHDANRPITLFVDDIHLAAYSMSITPNQTIPTSAGQTSNDPGTGDSGSSSKVPIIIGCVVGGLVLLAIIAAVIVIVLKRDKLKASLRSSRRSEWTEAL